MAASDAEPSETQPNRYLDNISEDKVSTQPSRQEHSLRLVIANDEKKLEALEARRTVLL
jgi:hypothetical protein